MSKKEKYINGLILFICTAATVIVLIQSKELNKMPALLKNINYFYIFLAVLCMVINLLLSGLIIKMNTTFLGYKLKYSQGCYLAIVGQYYSLITPFAAGGQPMQIYDMNRRYHIPVSKSTSVTMHKCFVYQIVVPVIVVISFLINYKSLMKKMPEYMPIIIIAVIINVVATIGFIVLVYNGKFVARLVNNICKFLNRFKLFKNIKGKKIKRVIEEYDETLSDMKNNGSLMVKSILLTILEVAPYFSVGFFVFRALGINGISLQCAFTIQVIVYAVISYIPTPGNAGASEGAFCLIFGSFIPSSYAAVSMLLWRGISYYINMFVSAIIVFIDFFRNVKGKEDIDERQVAINQLKKL